MVRRRASRGHGRRSRVLVPFPSFSPVVAPCNRTERPSSPNRPSSLSSEGNQPSHDAMMDSSALRDARDPSRAVTMTTRIIAPVGAFALGAYAACLARIEKLYLDVLRLTQATAGEGAGTQEASERVPFVCVYWHMCVILYRIVVLLSGFAFIDFRKCARVC